MSYAIECHEYFEFVTCKDGAIVGDDDIGDAMSSEHPPQFPNGNRRRG